MTSQTVERIVKDFELECGEVVDIEVEFTGYYNFGTCGIDLLDYQIVENCDDLVLTNVDVRDLECVCEWIWECINGENDED